MTFPAAVSFPVAPLLLFQGDSITDAGRDRSRPVPNDAAGLGAGYVTRIASALLGRHPRAGWRLVNRGVSGDRVVDLLARWPRDALHLQPDLVSVLVGVNDTWHAYNNSNGVSVERYEEIYRLLLRDLCVARPQCRLVLGEPFALPGGEFAADWMPELRERSAVVRRLAQEFGAAFVAYQACFDAALAEYTVAELAPDGVHPSPLGHELMAQAWLAAAGL
ncbi:MAG: SGNH/GDSL hydrolase family protein [Opitutae bacterium]|nr:SGNH/GDSL hydrolase family protein [Opitutae bacterium]